MMNKNTWEDYHYTIEELKATNAALLEALQKVTERFADVHRHHDDGWSSFRDMELIDVANEAIRKATE